MDYTGGVVTLSGELGLAPEWKRRGRREQDHRAPRCARLQGLTRGPYTQIGLCSSVASIRTLPDSQPTAACLHWQLAHVHNAAQPSRMDWCVGGL